MQPNFKNLERGCELWTSPFWSVGALHTFVSSSFECSLMNVIGWKFASLLDISPVRRTPNASNKKEFGCEHKKQQLSLNISSLKDLARLENAFRSSLRPALMGFSARTNWVKKCCNSSVSSSEISGSPALTALTTGVITATFACFKWWRMLLGVDCKAYKSMSKAFNSFTAE